MSKPDTVAFRALHAPGRFLVLPNAWDAASARVIEACGAEAIATTSAGLAWANGYPDGHALPTHVLIAAIRAIRRVTSVPLSVDIEGGYADDLARVADLVRAIVDAGAVGINLEDGLDPPEIACAKIAAARVAGAAVDLFVNVRTDVYLRGLVPRERAAGETIARAGAYRDAGADGIFVPGARNEEDVRRLVDASAPLPLGLMVVPGLADAADLRSWGVRRLSAGAGIASVAIATTRRLATSLLHDGRSSAFDGAADYGETNALFSTDGRKRPATTTAST